MTKEEKIKIYNHFMFQVKANMELVSEYLECFKGNVKFTSSGALVSADKKSIVRRAKTFFNENFNRTEIMVDKKLKKNEEYNQYWIYLHFERFDENTGEKLFRESFRVLYRDHWTNEYFGKEAYQNRFSGVKYTEVSTEDLKASEAYLKESKANIENLKEQIKEQERIMERNIWLRETFLEIYEDEE